MHRVAIAGIGETEYSRASGRSETRLALDAILAALGDAGIDRTEVDGLMRWSVDTTGEEEIAARYSEWKMRCPTHLSIGQEAVAAAVGKVLRRDDFAVSGHRAHAHYLGKGGNLPAMIAELYGKATGCSRGRGGSMHLIDLSVGFEGSTAIVANSIPVGVGLALAAKLKNTGQVSCIFFGDGAVEEGVFYESVNFAAVKKLPVLFLCENNLYSVYTPLHIRQPAVRKIHAMARGLGLESCDGDGNDVESVYQITADAVNRLRRASPPKSPKHSRLPKHRHSRMRQMHSSTFTPNPDPEDDAHDNFCRSGQ